MPSKKKSTSKRHTAAPRTATKKSTSASAAKSVAQPAQPAIIAQSTMPAAETIKVEESVTATASHPAASVDTIPAPTASTTEADSSAQMLMPSSTTQALIQSLNDPSADVACDAAIALGKAGEASAVEPLIAVMENADGFYHAVVRAAAATSLGQLGDTRAVPVLIASIRDWMAETSAETVRALALLGDTRAIEPLVGVVRNADGFYLSFVRRAAVLGLARLGGPEALQALREVVENYDEDPIIRQAAHEAIG